MIEVTRLDGSHLYINAELIETIESTPDTVLSLTNHHKIIVREPAPALVEAIIAYKRQVYRGAAVLREIVTSPA
jgi:flagellar protein FlbD